MKAVRTMIFILVVLVVSLAGCSKEESKEPAADLPSSQSAETPDASDQTVAVTVNGEEITNGQIAEAVTTLSRQMGGRMSPEQMGQMQGALRQQAMENVISMALLKQKVAEEGITVTQAEIDDRMDEIKSSFGSEADLSSRLAMMGMTLEMLEEEMETGLAVEKLMAEHVPTDEVSEADAKTYYDENASQFEQPERVRASHILIKSEAGDTEAMKKRAREEAESVLAEIKNGGDFAQLASEHSSCPSSQRGGDLDFFQRGQMVKPFEDAAFALQPGEVSGIVETQFGYHIIKVTDRESERIIPFDEVKDRIEAMLDGQRKQEAMKTYTDQLRASADIQYK